MLSESMSQTAARGRVRVIGKIQPPSELSCNGNQACISVNRTDGDYASITFADQSARRKEAYKLDWCYEQDEGIQDILNKEIKPLLREVVSGSNAGVIAYGARRSGKTRLMQGSEDSPGLAPLAVSEILLLAEEIGASVSISSYQLIQDHVYDALQTKDKEVIVLEDGGKIKLKGLSQAPVNSNSDFNKLFFGKTNLQKPQPKVTDEFPCRSHRGLIVYVSRVNDGSDIPLVGKMAFVDAAGYEDVKQKGNSSCLLSESTKINMSLYTLLNVIYAINSNEARIPFRESKLTRLLQEFIGQTSIGVLITCLKPTICQDTIHALSLAARSCQVVKQHRRDSIRKPTNGLRLAPSCCHSSDGAKSVGTSTKRVSHMHSVERKGNTTPSTSRRRFLPLSTSAMQQGKSKVGLDGLKKSATPMTTAKKLFDAPAVTSNTFTENLAVPTDKEIQSTVQQNCLSNNTVQQNCLSNNTDGLDLVTSEIDVNSVTEETFPEAKDSNRSHGGPDVDCGGDKENIVHAVSERLREVLNLLSPQPLSKKTPTSTKVSDTDEVHENHLDCNNHEDPKTPGVPFSIRPYDNQSYLNAFTPKDSLKTRSTGLKKSLAQECLNFLNSASKEELKALKGIGEKRATYILELRKESPEPFKDIGDISMHLGLTSKQINGMISKIFEDSALGNQCTPTKFKDDL